jgi:hypothetical protein
MYSSSNSHKETTMHKHVLHVCIYSSSGSEKEITIHKHIPHVFKFWLKNRSKNTQTHTPCIRFLTHTRNQQCTNTYSMYSGTGSVKEIAIYKSKFYVFELSLTQRSNYAQTDTPCIRILTHTQKQQCTNVCSMYSCFNSHKETTILKHILHVLSLMLIDKYFSDVMSFLCMLYNVQ